jgi:NADH-quinone oxidoreductase subunit N
VDGSLFSAPPVEWWALAPLLTLVGTALAILVLGALTPPWRPGLLPLATCTGAGAAAVLAALQWGAASDAPTTLVGGAIAWDPFAVLVTIVTTGAVLLGSLALADWQRRERAETPEAHALLLTAAVGGIVMANATDLVVTFLGLETLSLSLYVLAASNRRRSESQEAGLKYFILGGVASAFFLYGVALTYGVTGTTRLGAISGQLGMSIPVPRNDALLAVGVGMVLVGLAFKASLVPFHSWTPDVYHGSPTPVTGFMASAGKAAAVATLVRMLLVAYPSRADDWRPALWMLTALTLVAGSVLAIVQVDAKRMLAYSSIGHAGFMLVGLEAAGRRGDFAEGAGAAAVAGYVAIYALLALGTFAAMALVVGEGDAATTLDVFQGLGRRSPSLAAALTVLLLAQAGVPLTAGFVAKFGVLRAAVDAGSYWLAGIAMVSAVVAAYLYLRLVVAMWLRDAAGPAVAVPAASRIVLLVSVAATIALGVVPGWLLDLLVEVGRFAS